jgi:hypothetical protein
MGRILLASGWGDLNSRPLDPQFGQGPAASWGLVKKNKATPARIALRGAPSWGAMRAREVELR